MRKFVKSIAVIVALATTLVSNSAPAGAVSVMTVEQAAKKIYAAETKAYNTKKDVSLKLTLKAKNNAEVIKLCKKIEIALLQEELGDVDLSNIKQDAILPAIGNVFLTGQKAEKRDCQKFNERNFYYNASYGYDSSTSYRNGIATVKMTIKGSKKFYRDQYKEQMALKEIMEIINDHIEGLSEKDAAWKIATLLSYDRDEDPIVNGSCQCGEHLYINYEDGNYNTAPTDILSGKATGVCEHIALAYHEVASLAGLEAAYVGGTSYGEGHAWNAVKIDSKVYHIDLQINWETRDDSEWEDLANDPDGSHFARLDSFESSFFMHIKKWKPGTSRGEWYLLTTKEWAAYFDRSLSKPSTWKYVWDFDRYHL